MIWKKTLIPLDATIRDVVETINSSGFEIGLVVDKNERLLGTITDGDVRRGLLQGLGMEAPAGQLMNETPLTAHSDSDPAGLLAKMNADLVRQIPLVDEERTVIGLAHIRDLTPPVESRENWVVLMAGGLGERLMPLTEDTPKPLLNVGDKPLLQTILESFIKQNFRRFYISVNYRADAIKDHFGDGSKWDAEIRYLEEDEKLGTAGALRLIPEPPAEPLIVMNGDLITKINFQDLLDYHDQQGSQATMCVREYDFQVPFGVVDLHGNLIRAIDEKPIHRFFVNAGIYVLDPGLIDFIPESNRYDMTELFEAAINQGKVVTAFPVHEYWLDVGRMDDLNRAKMDFPNGVNS
ncbi:MAG: CBS domain-containing protein [Rhodospirillales bacterium]|nr:CBS domain-containing protein [Rhodospirillales bacterium]